MMYLIKKSKSSKEHLIYILEKYYDYQVKDIIYNEYKKPYLKDNPYYFSISHTKDMLAIIIDTQEVGIDIEYLRPYNKGIANKLFTAKEQALCVDNDELFTKIFIQKESYGKYRGTGLGEYLKEVDVLNNSLIKCIEKADLFIAITGAKSIQIKYVK